MLRETPEGEGQAKREEWKRSEKQGKQEEEERNTTSRIALIHNDFIRQIHVHAMIKCWCC